MLYAKDHRLECLYAASVDARVAKYERVEKALHIAFGPDRVNPKREFFEIKASQAIIKLMAIEDVTPKVDREKKWMK